MKVKEYITDRVLVFDGAMGTYYAKYGDQKCELANQNDPDTIRKIHREYIKAGCQAIKTNTFGANTVSLDCDFSTVRDVLIRGCELAKEAVKGTGVFVFADIGPIPFLETPVFEEYRQIVDVFLEQGLENFLFETFSGDEFLADLAGYIKGKCPQAFVLVEFAVSPEGFTRIGLTGHKLFASACTCPDIDAVGFNCYSGAHHLLEYIQTFDLRDQTVSLMPNAGYPTVVNNRTFFHNSSDYFASRLLEMAKCGVKILGGCCGTEPEYIRKTVECLRCFSQQDVHYIEQPVKAASPTQKAEETLLDKVESGKKIIAVELDPPLDTEIAFFMSSAATLKGLGVDAITIADCPIARARVDSSLLACKLKRELNITPLPHMTCRDRNINATKALLLGLNIEGVNNILVVTGDPVPSAQRDEIKAMFHFNSAILANYIATLNESTFHNPFNICAALNVNARNFDSQLRSAQKKIQNGVTMFLTQPVLTKEALENLKRAKEILPAKILGGIIPVVSHRNACFMNNEISGINVSQEIIDRYENVSKEQATELAVQISTQIAKEIADFVDGYYLITPFQRIDIISRIISQLPR